MLHNIFMFPYIHILLSATAQTPQNPFMLQLKILQHFPCISRIGYTFVHFPVYVYVIGIRIYNRTDSKNV